MIKNTLFEGFLHSFWSVFSKYNVVGWIFRYIKCVRVCVCVCVNNCIIT